MVILRAVRDQTQALDKILGAYAQIGNCLPRLERYQDTFSNDTDFQRLLAFLFEDITEFHTKALALLRKPAWKMFFTSSWGRFEQRFGAILESIGRTSALIDTEAASRSIVEMREWRQDVLEKAAAAEKRWESEQFQALMRWLETSDMPHQSRYDWLRDRACQGTGSWILSHTKFRAWMGRQRGNPVLWMNGKPGSGESIWVWCRLGGLVTWYCLTPASNDRQVGPLLADCEISAGRQEPTCRLHLWDTANPSQLLRHPNSHNAGYCGAASPTQQRHGCSPVRPISGKVSAVISSGPQRAVG